jgi:hypothetical protein
MYSRLLEILKSAIRPTLREWELPSAARKERERDRGGIFAKDPGVEAVIESCSDWLAEAQDRSSTHDGGVARHYGLIDGWSASYPETTGYIVPTMFDLASLRGSDEMRIRALRMLD